jgi:hypothetical protein
VESRLNGHGLKAPKSARQLVPLPGPPACGAVTLLCFALAGCATATQQRHERMHTALTLTSADVLDHGPPANTVDLGPSKKGFQWLTTQRCTVSIVAHATKPDPSLADWVIEHWRWRGVC